MVPAACLRFLQHVVVQAVESELVPMRDWLAFGVRRLVAAFPFCGAATFQPMPTSKSFGEGHSTFLTTRKLVM